MQEILQVDPALHEMLPLAPRVIEQLACSPQSTLQESPQAPPQVDCAPHASVQLAPQVCAVTSQLPLVGQAQVLPVQAGGLVDTPPQASADTASSHSAATTRPKGEIVMLGFTMKVRCRDPPRIRQAEPRARATSLAPGHHAVLLALMLQPHRA